MGELELDDEALAWSVRGIAQTSGWQVGRLYELACGVHERREEPLEILALRRAQHERMPSSSTYNGLRSAAGAVDAWAIERDAARATLERADLRGFVEVLIDDGDVDLAWSSAESAPREALGPVLWMRLAEARETDRPADAFVIYLRVAGEVLEDANRNAYKSGARILLRDAPRRRQRGSWTISTRMSPACASSTVAGRRSIAILDKAKLR